MDLRERGLGPTRHPWEEARYDFFAGLLRETRRLAGERLLDVGAGDAWLARRLAHEADLGALCCVDENYTDTDIRQLSEETPGATFLTIPPATRFDVITLLDVLEHVQDDVGFLRRLVEAHLEDRGLVLASVPAWPLLWTSHDVALGHHRRYTPAQLRIVIESAGLRVLRSGSVFSSLPLPRALSALREKLGLAGSPRTAPHSAWSAPWPVTRVVRSALAADVALARFAARHEIDLPGLSCWALCERRTSLA